MRISLLNTLTERLIVAFVTGVATLLTLLVLPIGFGIFAGSVSAKALVGVSPIYYGYVFSKAGVLTVLGAAIAGFLLGADRIATIFSFFWFTHPFWRRLGNNLNENIDSPHSDFTPLRWILLAVLLVLVIIVFLLQP